ncbi:Fc.00g069190.m01.CDS01 [Cosmosporella sp. VM-42]
MFENLGHWSWKALRHVLEILPAGALYCSGGALGLRQDCNFIVVIVPVWIVSATVTALAYRAALQAANFGRIAITIALLSAIYTLQNTTQNAPLLDQIVSCLRHYIMVTSMVAAVLAMVFRVPPRNGSMEPFPVEETNPLAVEATTASLRNSLDLMTASYATLDVLLPSTTQTGLSDVGSVAYDNMGPGSTCPGCSSNGGTEVSLRSTGRVKLGLTQSVVRWSSIAIPTSKADDASTEAQPDTQ